MSSPHTNALFIQRILSIRAMTTHTKKQKTSESRHQESEDENSDAEDERREALREAKADFKMQCERFQQILDPKILFATAVQLLLDKIHQYMQQDKIVDWRGETIAAQIHITPTEGEPNTYRIYSVAVNPGLYNHGIATSIVAQVVLDAKIRNRSVRLEFVNPFMEKAVRRIYNGFQPYVSFDPNAVDLSDKYFSNVNEEGVIIYEASNPQKMKQTLSACIGLLRQRLDALETTIFQ